MVVSAFWTPTVWRWLMDTCELQPEGGRAGRVLDDRRAGRCPEARSLGSRRRAPRQAVRRRSAPRSASGDPSFLHSRARSGARSPRVLAELIGGRAYRFPGPLPGAAMAVSGDRHGTMIEIYPESVVMAPGDGEAPVAYRNAPWRTCPRRLSMRSCRCRTTVPPSNASASAAGWRTKFFSRAAPGLPPVFHVVEVWVENRLLLEVVPADMIEVYESYMQIGRMDALDLSLQSATVARRQDLRGENDEWRECRRGPDRWCRPDRPVAGHHPAPLGHTGAHHRP